MAHLWRRWGYILFSRRFPFTLLSLLVLKGSAEINEYPPTRGDFTHLRPMSLREYLPLKLTRSAPLYAPSTASFKVSARYTDAKTLPPLVLNVSPSSLVPAWKMKVSMPQRLGVSQVSPVSKPLSVATVKRLSQAPNQHCSLCSHLQEFRQSEFHPLSDTFRGTLQPPTQRTRPIWVQIPCEHPATSA